MPEAPSDGPARPALSDVVALVATVLQITQIQFDFLSSFISWKYCNIALLRRLDDIFISSTRIHNRLRKAGSMQNLRQ